jgi:hypothetical protein
LYQNFRIVRESGGHRRIVGTTPYTPLDCRHLWIHSKVKRIFVSNSQIMSLVVASRWYLTGLLYGPVGSGFAPYPSQPDYNTSSARHPNQQRGWQARVQPLGRLGWRQNWGVWPATTCRIGLIFSRLTYLKLLNAVKVQVDISPIGI